MKSGQHAAQTGTGHVRDGTPASQVCREDPVHTLPRAPALQLHAVQQDAQTSRLARMHAQSPPTRAKPCLPQTTLSLSLHACRSMLTSRGPLDALSRQAGPAGRAAGAQPCTPPDPENPYRCPHSCSRPRPLLRPLLLPPLLRTAMRA